MSFISLDIGTSDVSGILIDHVGTVFAEADAPLETQHSHPAWVEQDPDSWITACDKVMQALRSTNMAAFEEVNGIKLSGHMHGATLIDANGKALPPCILWNDTRSASRAAVWDSNPILREASADIVFAGYAVPTLGWVAEHEPDVFSKAAKILLPMDYVRLWLTGDYLSDMSDSVDTHAWSNAALEAFGVRLDQMPDLVEGSAPVGMLRDALRIDWRLGGAVVVTGSAADNAAAACGIGCLNEGAAYPAISSIPAL